MKKASQVVDPSVPMGIDLAKIGFPFNYLLCSKVDESNFRHAFPVVANIT